MLSELSRNAFEAELQIMAQTYGVTNVANQFAVEPSIHQELQDAITLSSSFLGQINILPVSEIKGEKILGSVSKLVTSRTDTSGDGERKAKHLLDLDNSGYELFQTDMDTAIRYALIDAWAKFPDLRDRYSRYVYAAIALNKIMIGWHGTSVATTTDPVNNTMGQDVNKGWIQLLEEQAPEQIFDEGDTAGKIILGDGGDYQNLNDLVFGIFSMIPEEYADSGDLVAIVGRDLISRDKSKVYSQHGETPSEKEKVEMAQTISTYGGLGTYTVPYFPKRGVMVTSLNNLSIYYQDSSLRRQVVDNPKKNQYEDYMSRNEGYVLETPEKTSYCDSTKLEFTEEQV